MLAREKFQPFKRRVLANRHLSCCERQELFKSVIMARFLHGLGTVDLHTAQARGLFARKYMGLVRGAIRPLHEVPCRRLCDDQACALLEVVTPVEALDIAVAGTLVYVADKGDGYLRACLRGTPWLCRAREALARIARVVKDPSGDWMREASDEEGGRLERCPFAPSHMSNVLRKYRSRCVEARRGLASRPSERRRPMIRQQWKACCFPGLNSLLVLKVLRTSVRNAPQVSRQRLLSGFMPLKCTGRSCEVFRRQYWSTRRLRQHLKHSKICAGVYLEGDWPAGQPPEQLAADCLPPTDLTGPAPWWSLQVFRDQAPCIVIPDCPDPLSELSKLTSLAQLASFLRTWAQALESGWEPPILIDVQHDNPAAQLAIALTDAIGVTSREEVVHSGTLAAVVREDVVRCGPAKQLLLAVASYWRDM
eukprot:s7015_g3.t1